MKELIAYPSGLYASMIQDVNVSLNTGKQELFELGAKGPFFRYPDIDPVDSWSVAKQIMENAPGEDIIWGSEVWPDPKGTLLNGESMGKVFPIHPEDIQYSVKDGIVQDVTISHELTEDEIKNHAYDKYADFPVEVYTYIETPPPYKFELRVYWSRPDGLIVNPKYYQTDNLADTFEEIYGPYYNVDYRRYGCEEFAPLHRANLITFRGVELGISKDYYLKVLPNITYTFHIDSAESNDNGDIYVADWNQSSVGIADCEVHCERVCDEYENLVASQEKWAKDAEPLKEYIRQNPDCIRPTISHGIETHVMCTLKDLQEGATPIITNF